MKYPQVAADLGMENNNLACDQKQLNINGAEKIGYSCHIFGDEPNCKINYTRVFFISIIFISIKPQNPENLSIF